MRATELAAEMARRGLIEGDAPPLPFGSGGPPWYLSLLLGGAGWLASILAFSFVLLFFQLGSSAGALLAGLVMLGAGFALYRADRDSAFFEQLALALTLAGQLSLIYAAGDATGSVGATATFTAALQVALVFTLPNRFAKTLSAFFACIAWAIAIRSVFWDEYGLDGDLLAVALAPALVGWFVIWVPVAVGTHLLIQREVEWMASGRSRVARPALTGLLLALAVGTWASEPFAVLAVWAPPTDVPVNWLVLWPFLGVVASLFAGVCAFRLRHRAMIGVAIAGALLHVVQFYYLLGVPLVTKSYVMVVVGVALLIAARGLRMRVPPNASGVDAR